MRNAIDREKKLKGWRRKKKLLIAKFNLGWKDLAAGWYETQGPSTAFGCHLTPLGMTKLERPEQVSQIEHAFRKK